MKEWSVSVSGMKSDSVEKKFNNSKKPISVFSLRALVRFCPFLSVLVVVEEYVPSKFFEVKSHTLYVRTERTRGSEVDL